MASDQAVRDIVAQLVARQDAPAGPAMGSLVAPPSERAPAPDQMAALVQGARDQLASQPARLAPAPMSEADQAAMSPETFANPAVAHAMGSLATLPQRAIENSQYSLDSGTYDPGPTLEAATLPMGTGAVAGVPVRAGEEALGAGFTRRVFHGSPQTDLTKIATEPPARQFDNATSQFGAFFSPTEEGAQRYAGETGRTYATNLDLKNAYEMPQSEFNYYQSPNKGPRDADGFSGASLPPEQWASRAEELKAEAIAHRAELAKQGHDGIVVRNSNGDPVEVSSFNDVPLGIRAYHGSPHDFNAFSMDKIGTGEGAQAYGHGLYFAENEGVAKAYRDALTPKQNTTLAGAAYNADDPLHNAAMMLDKFGGDRKAAMDWMRGSEAMKPTYDALESGVPLPAHNVTPGKMYEVNINADPEHFLDWDKPLSQQSEVVRKAIAEHPQADRLQGADMVRGSRSEPTGQAIVNRLGADAVNLREAGIPGIKYLDQGSRAAGDGSRNYVVFNDKLIDIARKYGMGSLAALPPATLAALSGNPPDETQ